MKKHLSQAHNERIAAIVAVLGDKHNLLIFIELLLFGEQSFNALKRMTGINQVTLSRKLHRLVEEDLLEYHHSGQEVHYVLSTRAREYEPVIREIQQLANKKNTP